nr:NADH-quinone oxidoreductase subunit K [Candidatus Tectomicrobia bacterium]
MPISSYLVLSAMLFLIGVMGVLFRRNALIMFM